jgi:dienelactone hydrolase
MTTPLRRSWVAATFAGTLFCWLGPFAVAQPAEAPHPHFELGKETVLIDEVIPIVISGLPPGRAVTVRLRGGGSVEWSSRATFNADQAGVVDLTRTAPIRGDYESIDTMGLFWSARRRGDRPTERAEPAASNPPPEPWHLTAEVDGTVAATATVWRRAVAADVSVTMVHERGLVGVFYQPSGEGRHPAVIVVSGSGGGLPPASASPGGLASRGYAVLALAYFGVEGLPRSLHNIPLEYFGTAVDWLIAQPAVDPARVGVLGTSRGGELALLLASIFPQIRTVVAYVPSDVVWGGCCDSRNETSWTAGGRPLAFMTAARPNDLFARQQASIKVEHIHGAVLLISGRQDRVWPSADMAERVVARLRHNNFSYPFKHLSYDGAGHGIGRPYGSTMDINDVRHPLTGRIIALGGTPAGTARARADSWQQVLTFLDENLRRAAAPSGRQ